MKISKFIEALERLKAEYGDLRVVAPLDEEPADVAPVATQLTAWGGYFGATEAGERVCNIVCEHD